MQNNWYNNRLDLIFPKQVYFSLSIIDKLKKYVKVGLSTNGLLIESSIDTILKLDYMTISIDSYNLYSRYRSNHLPKFLDDIDLIFSYNRHPFIDIQTINFQEKDNVYARLYVDYYWER